jgi:lantibiotic modifying enzyme
MRISLRQKIQERLSLIENYYLSGYEKDLGPDSMGLLSGLAGIILLQSLFLQQSKNKKFKKEVDKNLNLLIETIEKQENPASGFCDGLSGIGWLFMYLNEKKIIQIDINDFLKEMDEVLEDELDAMIETKNFDLLHGALGVGLYFLKRKKYQVVEKIVLALDASCDVIGNEIVWKRFDYTRHKKFIYDFGLAHGNIGVLYFLGKCYQNKVLSEIVHKLLEGGINFYVANIQDTGLYGSYFPYEKLVDDYKNPSSGSHSRLGWCYGDPAVLRVLVFISSCIEDEYHQQMFTDLSIRSATERKKIRSGIVDACFCHGLSGVLYQCINLYKKTQNEVLLQLMEYWISKLIILGDKSKTKFGYLFYNGVKGWEMPPPNLLNGLGGISLALLSFEYDDLDHSWNEIFFLS